MVASCCLRSDIIWSEFGVGWLWDSSLSEDIVLVEEMDLYLEEWCEVEVGVSEEIVKLKESDVILKSVDSGEGRF